MVRKITQITASQSCIDTNHPQDCTTDYMLYALSDDGIVFSIDPLSSKGWYELPPLPQPATFDGVKGEQP
jgi:hypothetical protein